MIDLITAATLTNDRQLQKTAENAILQLRLEKTQQFLLQNANIMHNQTITIAIRQAAGTLLIASIKFKNKEIFLWDCLSPTSKKTFKEIILALMINNDKIIRRVSANIIATICCIEIPRNQWVQIAQIITFNMSHEDILVKEVSILTIGFICQQLKQSNYQFDLSLQQTILTGILLGVQTNHPQIVETAFKALRDGISSVTSLMNNQTFREFLITQIAQAFKYKQFIQYGIQCLTEFIKYNFAYLEQNYVEVLASLVDPFLKNPREETLCILAMDFWATFAKNQKSIQKNPLQKRFIYGILAEKLVQSLLKNLCEVEQGEQQGNGISDGAQNALQTIFEGDSSIFQSKVLAFTENTIQHQNWKYRQGSIRAFANLLIGLPEQISQDLVNRSLLSLVALLNDPIIYVQISAIRSLNLISEQAGKVILNHFNFLDIMQLIKKKAEQNQLFMLNSCKIIEQLCQIPNSKTFFESISDSFITFLLNASLEKNRSLNSISNCMCTILSLVTNSQSIVVANKYIDYVLNNFSNLSFLQKQKQSALYAGFYILSQICLITIRKAKGSITVDQMSRLYQLVINYFVKVKNVQGDGFYVISALTFFIPHDRRIIDNFWNYVQFGLKKTNQSDVFKAVISCICDFATTYKDKISDKIDYVFKQLFIHFENTTVMRQLKIDILMCFGELFLHCCQTSFKYIKKVMDLILASFEGVFQITDFYYAQVLQQTLIETLMCIYHGLKHNTLLAEYIIYIHKFVLMTTDKSRHPKLNYVKQSMILLADIAYIYQNQFFRIVDRQFIMDRIQIMNKFNNDGHLNNEIRYIKKEFGIKI